MSQRVFSKSSAKWWIFLSLAALLATFDATAAQRPAGKIDKELRSAVDRGEKRKLRVIVRVKGSDREFVKRKLDRRSRHVEREHRMISALTVEMPAEEIEDLARTPGVESLSIDAPLQAHQAAAIPVTTGKELLRTLGVPATKGLDGAGVGVAVIDSGIAPNADFGKRIRAFYDFTNGGIATRPYDDYGHGTHVAGLIGGSGGQSRGTYAGLAPKVSLIGLKVLGADGSGYTSDLISALEFATANKDALGIDIINLSLGHPPYEPAATDPLVAAVDRASAAGIVVVVSAGNAGVKSSTGLPGYGGIMSPGNARSAITVGSLHTMATTDRADDRIGAYSSRGPSWYDGYAKPDLVAPGHKLVAPASKGTLSRTYPRLLVASGGDDDEEDSSAGSYIALTGTSMAAAVTSGVVALILDANQDAARRVQRPPLTPNAVKAILQVTALTVRDEQQAVYDRLTQGAGGLNADGALALAAAIDTTAPVGSAWLASGIEPFSTIVTALPWSQNIIWGDNVIWGDSIYENAPAWAANIIWGDNVIWGENLIWGE